MATIIYNATQLQNMQADLTADYELGSDIDATETAGWNGGAGFVPIGQGAPYFTGTFDGKGHTITNLAISRNGTDFIGLFGVTDDATIQNVTLATPSIHGDDYTAALIGLIIGDDTLSNCHIIGGSVIGEDEVGGVVGYAISSATLVTIFGCSATCSVTSDAGAAANNNDIGGFIGSASGVDFDDCYATGDVVGIGEKVGGFVGNAASDCTFDKCFASGNVSTGDDAGDSFCGGFVGWSDSTDNDCYAVGSVTATGEYVGGYAGVSPAIQTNCYSTGAVVGVGAGVGGFNGNLGGIVTNCFWDTETSGQGASEGGTGKTTEQMKAISTFQAAGWAISRIWGMTVTCNNGYPCLIGVNPCCPISEQESVDQTVIGNKVSLEAIRNLEIVYGGRDYISKLGNWVHESRYHRNV